MTAPGIELPEQATKTMDELIASASNLTMALIAAMFVPIVFLYVIASAVLKLRRCAKLTAEFPELDKELQGLATHTRKQLTLLAQNDKKVKRLWEFKQARVGFLIFLVVPFAYVGFIVTTILLVS